MWPNYGQKKVFWPQNQYSIYVILAWEVMWLGKLSWMHIKPIFYCMPNQVCQNNFCHSILTQLKFPLAVLSVSSIGMFLQEEIKLGFILKAQKCLHQVGGVQVHSTIALTLEMRVDSLPKSVHRAVRQVTVAVASIRWWWADARCTYT